MIACTSDESNGYYRYSTKLGFVTTLYSYYDLHFIEE